MKSRLNTAIRGLTLLLLLAVSFGSVFDVRAQQATAIRMTAEAAYQGFFKFGEWLPVFVTLENNGADLQAEIRVRVVGSYGSVVYASPADLPAGARKRIPVYVLPNSYSRELSIQLYNEDAVLQSLTIKVEPQVNLTYMVGVIAPQRGGMSLLLGSKLPGQPRPIVMVDIPLADLVERAEALRTFDVIILNDVDTSNLTPLQQAALTTWVERGGRLVIGGGAGALRTASGLPELLLPLAPDNLVEADSVAALADYAEANPVRVPGPFLSASGEVLEGSILAEENGLPLVIERSVGSGNVDFITLDLAGSPFDAWEGTTVFWSKLLSPGAAYPDWMAPDYPARNMIADRMGYALSSLPALDLPSVKVLSLLLGAYILLVGPLNYIFLRWRKRMDWAWITIPVLTIAFTAGTFGLGYAMRGTDLIMHKLSLIRISQSGVADVTSFLGLFSPAQQSYEIEVTGDGLLSPLRAEYDPWSGGNVSTGGESQFLQGNPGIVRGLTVNQWSMQAFMTEGRWQDFGTIDADLTLAAGTGLTGKVTNRTEHTLTEVVVVMGNQFVRLGDMAPGESQDIALAMPDSVSSHYGPGLSWLIYGENYNATTSEQREMEVRRAMLDGVFQPEYVLSPISSKSFPNPSGVTYEPVFLGWVEGVSPEVEIGGENIAERSSALVSTVLEYSLPRGENVSLPVGLLPGRLSQLPTSGGTCGAQGASVFLDRGEALFEFQIPEKFKDVTVDALKLMITSDSGFTNVPETAFYDWELGDWTVLEGIETGVTEIADAGRLVGADDIIRLRLASENSFGGGCLYLDMGMTGQN